MTHTIKNNKAKPPKKPITPVQPDDAGADGAPLVTITGPANGTFKGVNAGVTCPNGDDILAK